MNDDKKWVFIGLGLGAVGVFLFSSFSKKPADTEGGNNQNMNKGKTDSAYNRSGASFAMFNMNPLNIKPGASRYPGEITSLGAIHRMFESWTTGTAGGMIHLWRYINGKVDGGVYPTGTKLNTIEKIVRTWAPANDNNDTENYIGFVVNAMRIPRTQVIQWSKSDILPLVAVMAIREDRTAAKFVDDDVLLGAWAVASKYVLDMRFY